MSDKQKPIAKAAKDIVKEAGIELVGTLRTELSNLLDAGQADIDSLVTEIAPVLATAAAQGDSEMTAELQAQLWAVVELNAIRNVKAGWRVVKSVSSIALRMLSTGLALGKEVIL